MKRIFITRLFVLLGFFTFMLSTGMNTSCMEACQGGKGDGAMCNDYGLHSTEEEDPAYDSYFDSDGYGTTDDLCDASPSDYGVTDTTRWLYVSPTGDDATAAPGSKSAAFKTIQAALDYRANSSNFNTDPVAIYLANDTTFEESIVLDSSGYSNTIFVGCTSTATLAPTPNSTTAFSATTHTIEVSNSAENVGFYHLTIEGIGGTYNTTNTADGTGCTDSNDATTCPYLETSTLYLNNATGFVIQDSTVKNNYSAAIVILGPAAHGDITDTTLSDFVAGAGDGNGAYDDKIGIRVSGSSTTATTLSGLTVSGVNVGVHVLDGNANITNSTIDGIEDWAVYLSMSDTQPTASISNTNFTNNRLAIYSTDAASLSLDTVSIDNTHDYGLISCQYDSTDVGNSANTIDNGSMDGALNYFDTVTVNGSGAAITGTCSYYNATMNSYSGDCTESTTQLCTW